MGGFAGHMMHLNDNPNLTFGQMKDIFEKASKGKLVGTEKTDGQNLFLSYSVRHQEPRAVRNKGDIKKGGMDPAALASKFADRGDLTTTFVESFDSFDRAVKSLPIETQIKIFGPDANNFYNAEIMNPGDPDCDPEEDPDCDAGTANVVNYDTRSLLIHRVGHHRRDKSTGETEPLHNEELVKELESALVHAQQSLADNKYKVQVNAIQNLRALSSDKPLEHAMARLDSFMSESGLTDSNTIGDYIIKTIGQNIDNFLPQLDEKVREMLLKRVLGQKGAKSITQIKAQIPQEDTETLSKVQEMVDENKSIFKWIMFPLEDIVHDFAVEMLRGLESIFILDNTQEIKRLYGEVEEAIEEIKSSGNDGAMQILKRNMEKLKDLKNVSTAAEGFVFDYDGNTYKFTGTFAPVNQILGLFKYGRGDIPPLKRKKKIKEQEQEIATEKEADIALLPGSFKPPHRGHLSLADAYSKVANEVVILISDPQSEKSIRKLPVSGEIVIPEMAKDLWETYLSNAGIDNATVMISPSPSPVGAVYDYLDNLATSPDGGEVKIILGTSTKGGDEERYTDLDRYQDTNVNVVSRPLEPLSVGGEDLHASDMRAAIDNMDVDDLETRFLPSGVSGEHIINIIKSQAPILDPEEDLEETSAMAGLGGTDVGGYSGKPNKKRKPTLFREEGMIMREEMVVELKFREMIRKRITGKIKDNKNEGVILINENQKKMLDEYHFEYALRRCIRKMILQEKTEPTPHNNTGINQLSDLLKKIVPILSVGFKSLTTDEQQRTSYRSHIINAVINALAPAQAEDEIDSAGDETELAEVDLNIEDDIGVEDEKFIDIDPPKPEEEEESFKTLPGQDLTGRNVAQQSFDRIERIILDSYDVLDNEKDQDLFYDYLLTNLKLYFDKFEGELAGSEAEPTTDEYEAEKAEEEELPEETPAELEGGAEEPAALQEKAPPGMKKDVEALKRDHSDETAFKIAWGNYNKKKKKKKKKKRS